jgi:hypothetical protein
MPHNVLYDTPGRDGVKEALHDFCMQVNTELSTGLRLIWAQSSRLTRTSMAKEFRARLFGKPNMINPGWPILLLDATLQISALPTNVLKTEQECIRC